MCPHERPQADERNDAVEIQGKKAVIVGGASGMAKASAEMLKAKGASIAILDLPTSAGAEVAKELGGTFHPVNVMKDDEVDQFEKRLSQRRRVLVARGVSRAGRREPGIGLARLEKPGLSQSDRNSRRCARRGKCRRPACNARRFER